MTPVIETCPHCGAPLPSTRFAAVVTCSFCDAAVRIDRTSVSAKRYHEAWSVWNDPGDTRAGEKLFSIDDTHWLDQRLLASGEISDVHLVKRARWPTELALLKIVRDPDDAPLLDAEWSALDRLHAADSDLRSRVPSPVIKGLVASSGSSNPACAYRWAGGFLHTFEMVRAAHPDGIPPVASIWVWRRILEVLGVMRRCGLVHGAILPNHLLVENGEHGVRIVGFSCADAPGAPLRVISTAFEDFYPAEVLRSQKLTASVDLIMSARCVAYILGGSAGRRPRHVPKPLADVIGRFTGDVAPADDDPWTLHKELGALSKTLFGPPAFHPIAMP